MDRFLLKSTASLSNKRRLSKSDSEDEPDDTNASILNEEESNDGLSSCYLFNGKYFRVIKTNNDSDKKMSAQCQLCQKVIQGQKGSTGNFLSHIKVCMHFSN